MLRLRWIFLAALLGLFAAIMGTSYYVEMKKINRLTALVDERMAVLVSMSRTVQELQEKIAFFGTSEGLAHLAREKYNLSFPEELVFKIERAPESLP